MWLKALRKMQDAKSLPVDTVPGVVITSSYAAMRTAAVAVLLATGIDAPAGDTAIIAAFGTTIGVEGDEHGKAFNSAFDLQTTEVYDAFAAPSVEEATTTRSEAAGLIAYCARRYGLPANAGPAGGS